ncbi:hypothetical protein EYZ11_008652 [Aspergillus tanneri]|uniref:Uncharacterized protein n=1 Tax=Aspergillus tanneri TaxID=1220188 RepID=A0A4S3JAB2_9EURO|nr:hypothetical protein EYZ11_008652 [Aspergillus tanneri]
MPILYLQTGLVPLDAPGALIRTKIFYEIKDILGLDLDWQFLCLKLEELAKTSKDLYLRRHILQCLDKVEDIVCENLEGAE